MRLRITSLIALALLIACLNFWPDKISTEPPYPVADNSQLANATQATSQPATALRQGQHTITPPATVTSPEEDVPHIKGEFIATVYPGVSDERLASVLDFYGLALKKEFKFLKKDNGARTIHIVPKDPSKPRKLSDLLSIPELHNVSLNKTMELYSSSQVLPDDPFFFHQWGLHNTESNDFDNDIDAPEAWSIQPGDTEVVIAIIDTGVDYRHKDLLPNLWTNPMEVIGDKNSDGYPGIAGVDDDGDGLIDENSQGYSRFDVDDGVTPNPFYINDLPGDDDENGFEDDIYGIAVGSNKTDPMDIQNNPIGYDFAGHGTHVAGIIAAAHNTMGTAGVAPNAKIMILKGFQDSGEMSVANELDAYDYILAMKARGVNIVAVNASYGCRGSSCFDITQKAGIEELTRNNIVLVAAAGNGGTNNDGSYPVYPCSYDVPEIICVAATNQHDQLINDSNYGITSVDIAAPGKDIISTDLPLDDTRDNIRSRSGTSMAVGHVSGAIAVLASVYPAETNTQRWQRIVDGVDLVGTNLSGKISTGGRLNLHDSLSATQTCDGDTRGDNDVDGLDIAIFITGGTVFTIQDMVPNFGSTCP